MVITTLENLPQIVQGNRLKSLAINIVKYQKFKTSVIIKKIDNCGYSRWSLLSYINNGIMYINSGKKVRQAGGIYNYIDEAIKQHIQPLVPTKEEHRLTKEFKKNNSLKNESKENILPVQNVLKELTDIQYAVQIDNSIRLCDSIDYAKAFKDGLVFTGCNNAKIVKIKIKECE